MQGQIKDPTYWNITEERGGRFVAERVQRVAISAEDLAKAKAKLLAEFGGNVDIRGWHRQGASGQNLKRFVDLRDLMVGANGENGTEKVLEVH